MYPLEAKSDTRIEQAANTEVMPAAVPSIVFSNISEKKPKHKSSENKEWKDKTQKKLNSLPVLLHLSTPYLYPIIDA